MHSYPGQGGDLAKKVAEWNKQKGNKLMYVEELGIEWRKAGWDIAKVFADVTSTLNSAGVPWMSWMLIPDVAGNCKDNYNSDTDYNIIPLDKAGDIAKAMSGAAAAKSDQHWGLGAGGGSATRPLTQGNGTLADAPLHTNNTSSSVNGTASTGGSSSTGETSSSGDISSSGGTSTSSETSSTGETSSQGSETTSQDATSSGSSTGSGKGNSEGDSTGAESSASWSKGDATSKAKGDWSKGGNSLSDDNRKSW